MTVPTGELRAKSAVVCWTVMGAAAPLSEGPHLSPH